ncbi:cyclin-D1-1-like [Phalaenopsis equestris]|uniref:cyclin-D1-1-like n=1 Tax=Phalaenopsis equestris TaxID=78828 RepID=UPI0009E5AE15|nr:cyclin-D1-1-like [Phalaenopsis equestris]
MAFSTSHSLYCAEDAVLWDSSGGGDDSGDEWSPSASDLIALLSAETEHMPCSGFLSHSLDITSRHDSINWILKVIDFHRFRPVTAYLSVDYLDRFLSANSLPVVEEKNGWPMQLLSVACISIAAKMEETQVPLLLDLQILDPKYLFAPRTIRRMELILMAALQWRMRSITPFDFLPHFASVVLPCVTASRPALFSRTADLIISTRRVVDFIKNSARPPAPARRCSAPPQSFPIPRSRMTATAFAASAGG